MGDTLAVRHGAFGRATINRLDRPLAMHAHREGHVIVTLRGAGSAIVSEGERLPLERGRAVLIEPWRPHRFAPAPGPASEFLTLYIEPDWFCARHGSTGRFPDAERTPGAASVPLGERRAELADDIAAMVQPRPARPNAPAPTGDPLDASPALEDAMARLVAALFAPRTDSCADPGPCGRHAGGDGSIRLDGPSRRTPASGPAPSRSVADFRIRRAMRLLRAAVEGDAETDLDGIAREAGLSRPHFFKLFREHVGVTPGTYLNTLKMERSYERLAAGTDTVTDIGLDLGFASQASFTRFFIAQSGFAPTDYRQALAARALGRPHNETVRYA